MKASNLINKLRRKIIIARRSGVPTKLITFYIRFLKFYLTQKKKIKNIFSGRKYRTFPVRRSKALIFDGNWFVNNFNYLWNRPIVTFFSVFVSVVIIATPIIFYDQIIKDLPAPQELSTKKQILSTKITDRDGELLFTVFEDENRTLVPISYLPDYVVQATVAIEDQHFYQHHGFDLEGIIRALRANYEGESIQGGSTITQQLVKNRLLTPERTMRRKIRELILSILVEGTYTKDEIMEMYLNTVPYGGTTYGIEEASRVYFGKHAQDLTLGEAALLAGLPVAPSVYSPFSAHPELAFQRQNEVLRRMVEDGFISPEQATAAKEEELVFNTNAIEINAPHFVMYVRQLLAERYGEDLVNQGGLQVRTTLDLDLQAQTQEIVTQEMESLARLNINNGAALVTNPKTGEILAMVGSKNYFDFAHDGQVNVALRPRQPGSSIKPITYALALESGKTPTTLIDDTPITYQIAGSPAYSPQNYDGQFHGRVYLKQALASSYNVPAVKLLAELGVSNLIDKAELMGISTWTDRQRFGLSLTLGGGEVLMTDMAQVYGTFANQGLSTDLNPILEVKNSQGKVLYRNGCALDGETCPSIQAVDPRVAYQISNILSDNRARTPAFGPLSVLNIPGQEVAVKTGTTNQMKDNWTIGYTSDRVVAVWVGNNDNTSMSYVASGITGASPIWNKIINLTLNKQQAHHFQLPDGLVKLSVCPFADSLSCGGCWSSEEYYLEGTQPQNQCQPNWFNQQALHQAGTGVAGQIR